MQKYSNKPLSFDELTNFEHLYKAHKVARLGKRHKKDVIDFENNFFENINVLNNELRKDIYKVSDYKTFFIFEPKKREIQALGYRDRIVQHAICDNYFAPYYKNRLIFANCACQEGKGSFFARQLLKKYLCQYYKKYGTQGYVLKCDVKKYFANINHYILKKQLQNCGDKKIKHLIDIIIDSYHFDTKKGLPIGNQVSQILGVVYLDNLDRLIKEKLQIKYYVRYMDDLVLIHHDKDYLKYCLMQMIKKMNELDLCFNEKTQIFPLRQGIEFLGGNFYVLNTGKILVRVKKQARVRFYKSLKSLKKLKTNKDINFEYQQSAYAGHKGHFKGFDAYYLLKKVKEL